MVLPYLGTQPLRLKKKLIKPYKNLFNEQLPSGKLEIVFRTTQRMSSCFKFKDAIPPSLLSGVIYECECPRCNSRYKGQPTDIGRREWKSTYICQL